MTMQIRRRVGFAGAPTGADLVVGQLGYHKDLTDDLYVGDGTNAVVLVSPTRQVELAGAQTITGAKTFSPTSFHLTGGANNNILTTDGAGNVSWTAAPSGGLLSVSTDTTLGGNGTAGDPLSVLKLVTARNIGIQGGTDAVTGSITTISATAAAFDGSANVTITPTLISLDDGEW